jgi:hypothetical protein
MTVYRVIDPITGLNWTGNTDQTAKKFFDAQGAEYKCSLATAQRKHRSYKALREVLKHLPETFLVEQQITFTETARFDETIYDDESMEDYRYLARYKTRKPELITFARAIRHRADHNDYPYIVIKDYKETFPFDKIGRVLHPSNRLGGDKSNLLALTSLTDLIFLRLSLEELFAVERITGRPVIG